MFYSSPYSTCQSFTISHTYLSITRSHTYLTVPLYILLGITRHDGEIGLPSGIFWLQCQFLYVPIVWKQSLLLTKAAQFVYWWHNGRADPGMSPVCWCAWIMSTIMTLMHKLCSIDRVQSLFSSYWDIHKFDDSMYSHNDLFVCTIH